MQIKGVIIDTRTKFKIYKKHGVKFNEIKQALSSEYKFIRKTKDGKYIAFTKFQRYLTIIFSIEKETAVIITAYLSSKWQINLLRRKIKT